MEVKIKNQNELIDATIEMVDGVMVVSPKESKEEKIDLSQFKEGDILYCSHADFSWLCIYKGDAEYIGKRICMEVYCPLNLNEGKEKYIGEYYDDRVTFIRHATDEERQKLFQALADEGLEWDAEKKQIVKLKWKPKFEEVYYTPSFNEFGFEQNVYRWGKDDIDSKLYEMGWVFRTKQECQAFCDRLNKVLVNIKP